MARWEPNAPRRLADAALELFSERGYEDTTVLDIAQRAGLAKSSFFRHFQDKRAVLFGEDALTAPLLAAIAAAPADATPLDAVAHGLDALGREVFTPSHRAFTVRRRAVIEAHPDLQEREAVKEAHLVGSISRALADRGAPELVARTAAHLGALALRAAYERWSDPGNTDEFGDISRQTVDDVRTAVSAAQEPH